eukprot:Nk52_evm40s1810 gene=Nk52_evmTU40s1810
MPCCGKDEFAKRNSEISRSLKRDQQLLKREIKLLLLGSGSCGKSTIVKQMRIIHGEGYSEAVRKEYIFVIHKNIVQALLTLISGMRELGIVCEAENEDTFVQYESELRNSIDSVKEPVRSAMSGLNVGQDSIFPPEKLLGMFERVWSDSGIQKCYTKRNLLQVEDSAIYFFENIKRICDHSYIPTQQDVLHTRAPTSGIIEYKFCVKDNVYRMIDVGGQRSERRKWIHCFEDVTAIIFVVALSEYDQTLFEDREQNRMKESLALFGTIVNYEWFKSTSIILFLNKKDVLKEKVEASSIAKYFPEYYGDPADVGAVQEFILDMYVDLNRCETKSIYPHFTCAPDTENIKFVFEAVADTILNNNLRGYGLI